MCQHTDTESGSNEVVISGATGAATPGKQFDWMIEEFKALRAEILANEDYQKNLLLFGTTVLATALGFLYRGTDFNDKRAVLLLLTEILAASFWHAFQRLALSTEEIGTYILFRMEIISALNWETFQRVEKLTRSTESHGVGIGGQSTARAPIRPTWQNKKSLLRRMIDSLGQSPFFIFAVMCCYLIFREANTVESWVFFGFSLGVLGLSVYSFVHHVASSLSPRNLRDRTEQQLGLSAHYRHDYRFQELHELGRFKDKDTAEP